MNSQGVTYQVRASEAPDKSIVRGWPIKFVHQRPPVNDQSGGSLSSSCIRGPWQLIVRGWPIKFVHQRPLVSQ